MSEGNRQPRPLLASPSLTRALDACASTYIDGLRGARKKKPSLSLVALNRLETEIGASLHDDILVLLALRDPVVALLTGIGDITHIADAAESPAPEGWICISTVYSDPVGALIGHAHGAAYIDLAIPAKPQGAQARIVPGWDGFSAVEDATGLEGVTIEAFIDQMLHDARSGEWGEHVSTAPGKEVPLDPQPKLIRGRKLRTKNNAGGRVSHPKFGVGEVVERISEGADEKLVIRFADKERKLLARFVQTIEGS